MVRNFPLTIHQKVVKKRGQWIEIGPEDCTSVQQKKELLCQGCGKNLRTSSRYVQRTKARIGLKTFKKQKKPKRSFKQAACAKTRARKFNDSLLCRKSACIIMDDETYKFFYYKMLPGDQFYSVWENQDINYTEKSIFVEKFRKKAMNWQAICECGKLSKPFVTTQTK